MGDKSPISRFRAGFFAYPWDLAEDGPAQVIELMAQQIYCNAIYLNANYHHARLLRPRSDGPKTQYYNEAIAAFQPQEDLYRESGLLPVVNTELAESNVLGRTRQACTTNDIDFGVWVVGLHNSSLGEAHPDRCVVNCFGDTYTYALCPSQVKNQDYMMALARDICQQFEPDRIAVEAIGVLGLRHWVHHELFMTEWDESLELLTSVCFCPDCMQKGQQQGVDGTALRERIVSWGNILLNEERGTLPPAFTLGETASLLLEMEDLWPYLKACEAPVTELVDRLHAITGEYDVAMEVIPSSFHRPVSRAWLERASLRSLAQVSDGLFVSSYFATPAEVEADLRWASYIAPDATLIAGINACAPTPNAATLAAQAAACVTAGCEGVYYYNYGLLNEKRLAWVAQANRSILNS